MNPTTQNPLAALKDIHLPPTPGWWPPAPGWWLITFLIITLIAVGFYKLRRRQIRRQPIKLALLELAQLDLKTTDPVQQKLILQDLSALLRRFCLVFFPHQATTGLCGQAWLNFIKENFSGEITALGRKLDDNDLKPLLEDAYAPESSTDLITLGKIIEQWFKQQKKRTQVQP